MSLRVAQPLSGSKTFIPTRAFRNRLQSKQTRAPHVIVRAQTATEEDRKKKELVGKIQKSLRDSGLDAKNAQQVLKNWQDSVGHNVTPEDLRKVLVGQSTKAIGLVAVSTLLDAAAAYGAFSAGNFFGLAAEQYGWFAVIGQALAYAGAGYYASGALFDLFKLGAVSIAAINFNVNSAAFLDAVEDIAGAGTGLNVADKALEAVNSVKILQALNTMSDMLRQQSTSSDASSSDMLADLGAYLTLDKAQRAYGFNAASFGLSEMEAAEIAVVFSRFDLNDDGVLSEDEFKKLCVKFSPELSTPEIKAALAVIDTNKDGTIEFDEFVRWWQKNFKA